MAEVTRHKVYEGGAFGCAFVIPDTIDAETCASVSDEAAAFVLHSRGNHWDTKRHNYAATTDLDVLKTYDPMRSLRVVNLAMPALKWMRELYAVPPKLDLEIVDFFIATYAPDEQPALMRHVDGSLLSFVIMLSDSGDYDGGNTHVGHGTTGDTFDVRLNQGQMLVFPGGLLHHRVTPPVTRGRRYVLTGFVDIVHHQRTGRTMLERWKDRIKETVSEADKQRHRDVVEKCLKRVPRDLEQYANLLPDRP